MREIKFRVWVKRCYDKHEEVYIGGYMIESKFLSQIDFFNETIITCFFVDGDDESVSDEEYFDFKEVELMQYTGLKDKNGIEIYEGDIVKWGRQTINFGLKIAVVELSPALQFRVLYYKDFKTGEVKKPKKDFFDVYEFGNFHYKNTEKHLEVVGNIFENTDIIMNKNINKN